jgi:phosphatidylglycerol:prolipoprotein diacylglycerol transferase
MANVASGEAQDTGRRGRALQEFTEGFVIGIDPVLFRLGPISLRWYGVMIALGITVGVYLALREARRKGVDEDVVYSAALWSILGGIVGARVLHVVDKLDFYLQNPAHLFSLAPGGMAIWGGVLSGLLVMNVYARSRHLSALRLADIAAPGLLLGQVVGRIGNLINGDAWGAPTSLPWGLVYVHPDAMLPPASVGIATHPYPLYEIAWGLLVFGLLWQLRERLQVDGALFAIYVLLYSAGRFALTFVREEGLFLFGLQQAQVIAAGVFLVALPFLVYLLAGDPAKDRYPSSR